MNKVVLRSASLILAVVLALGSFFNGRATSQITALMPNRTVNLAFFYKPPTNSTAATVATFGSIVLTAGDEPFRDELVSNGFTSTIPQYYRAEAIMDPGSCTTAPYKNQIAYKVGDFCDISQNHPDWFLLDTNGNRIRVGGSNYYRMDPGNSGWRSFFVSRLVEVQQQRGWAGVFLDNLEGGINQITLDGVTAAKYPDNNAYRPAVRGFVQYLYQNYAVKYNRPLLANIIARSTTDEALWFDYMQYLDGAMQERWAVEWNETSYLSESNWLADMTLAEKTQAQGKDIILVAPGQQADTNRQKFAFASFLLISNGRAAFRYSNSSIYREVWMYDNYKVNLGTPLGARYQSGSSWRRDFTNGYVIVDPIAHTATISTTPAPTPTFTSTATTAPTLAPTQTATALPSSTSVNASSGFPSTPLLDNFNRSNGTVGANWSGVTSSFSILNNQLDSLASTVDNYIMWKASSFGASQEAYITLVNLDTAARDEHSLILKSQSNTSFTNGLIDVQYDHSVHDVQVWTRHPSDGWKQHGTAIPITFANGDQFGARAKADGTVEIFKNGVLIGSRSVASWPFHANGGYIGVWFATAPNALADNFGGGSLTSATSVIPSPTSTIVNTPIVNTPTQIPPTKTATAAAVNTAVPSTGGTTYDENNSAFVYSGTWRPASTNQAYGGTLKITTQAGASVTLSFTGQSFTVLYKTGSQFGKMDVFVDGNLVGTINQNSANTVFQKKWTYGGTLSSGTHTLKLVFSGPSGTRASLDAVSIP